MEETSGTDTNQSSENVVETIDRQLLEAAKSGDSTTLKDMAAREEADVLLRTTKNGSNCLHIACIHSHLKFCKDALEIN